VSADATVALYALYAAMEPPSPAPTNIIDNASVKSFFVAFFILFPPDEFFSFHTQGNSLPFGSLAIYPIILYYKHKKL
jgi:hypothetical protein